ncbi:phosphoglycerate dehydrogenase [Murdochiella vaginalis]|uniref:phosphoglycerate dehydrogenase n=1 Tax=Murdochiella vaginalis TaxID=1852373 RepID=UPI0008FDB59E|nr:phosphoglycerate dehydrogenase [Murdochiella vaginalis]
MKILITPRSFGKYNMDELKSLLSEKNIEYKLNPYGRILTEDEMIKELEDMDGVIVGVDPLNNRIIEKSRQLKAISKYGVGVDNIDVAFAKSKGIPISVTRGANSDAVADYTFSLLLAVARRLIEINNTGKAGDWSKKISLDVFKKKLGVIGMGAIGKKVIERAKGFQMEVLGFDIFEDQGYMRTNHVRSASIKEIMQECDFVSLHLPLTPETKHVINKDALSLAKKNLVLINTARGGLIEEEALYQALKEKRIYGAGLDAFEEEGPCKSPLFSLDNVVIGTHTAASTIDATKNMSLMSLENLIHDLEDINE